MGHSQVFPSGYAHPPSKRGRRRWFSPLLSTAAALVILVGCGGNLPPDPEPTPPPCTPGSCSRDMDSPEQCLDGDCVPCPTLEAQWSHLAEEPLCSTPERPIKHYPPSSECPVLTEACAAPPPLPEPQCDTDAAGEPVGCDCFFGHTEIQCECKTRPQARVYWLHPNVADATPASCGCQNCDAWEAQDGTHCYTGRYCCPVGCEDDPLRGAREKTLMGGDLPVWELQVTSGNLSRANPGEWSFKVKGRGTGRLRWKFENGKATSRWLEIDR